MIKIDNTKWIGLLSTGIVGVAGLAEQALAGGYQMQQRSASGLGRALSGEAAIADDASVIASNPSGILSLKEGHHLTLSGSYLLVDSSVSGDFNSRMLDEDLGVNKKFPSVFYGYHSGCDWGFGLSIHAAYAQHTNYDSDFIGITLADETEFTSVAFRPTVAWRVNEQFDIGASFDIIHSEGNLTSSTPNGGRLLHLDGDDISLGFSLGAMWQATDKTRFGMQFRSKSKLTLAGKATSDAVAAFNSASELDLELPETIELSVYHVVNNKWAVHGDILWTNWSRFQTLSPQLANGAPVPADVQDWDDAIRVSAGATYTHNDQLKFRAGIAWDQTPVPDSTRGLRNPGADAMWYTLGGSYQLNDIHSFDAAIAYIVGEDVSIVDTGSTGTFTGNGQTDIAVFAFQWNLKF